MPKQTASFDAHMAEEAKRIHQPIDCLQWPQSSGPDGQMQDYRVYFVGPDGHVQNRVDLRCTDDAEAIKLAKQLFDGRDVELWQLDRKIGTIRDTSDLSGSTPSRFVTFDRPR
jgi:hypothetical protein